MAKYKESIIRKIPVHYVENKIEVDIGIGTVSVFFQNLTSNRIINEELFQIAALERITLHRSDMIQVLITKLDRVIEMEVRFNPYELKKKMRMGVYESKRGTNYKVLFVNVENTEKKAYEIDIGKKEHVHGIDMRIEQMESTFLKTKQFQIIEKNLNELIRNRKALNKTKQRMNRLMKLLQVFHSSGNESFKEWIRQNLHVLRGLPHPQKEQLPIVYLRIIRFYYEYLSIDEFEREFKQSSRIMEEQDAISFFGRMNGLNLPYRAITPFGLLLKDWDEKRFNPYALEKILSYLDLSQSESNRMNQIVQQMFRYNEKQFQLKEKSDLAACGYIKVTSISMKKRREILLRECIPQLGLQRTVDLLYSISNLHKHQKHAHVVYTSDLQYLRRVFSNENINWPQFTFI